MNLNLLQLGIQEVLYAKHVGLGAYLRYLASPPDEPDEQTVKDFVAAVKLSGLTWQEVKADFHAAIEREKLEARISSANATIDRASAAHAKAMAAYHKIADAKVRQIGDRSAVPLNEAMAAAEGDMKRASRDLDDAEPKLRDLRANFPRVRGLMPDVTL